MANFPTISVDPQVDYDEELAYDPSLRSQQSDGTIVSRAKFTVTKKKFKLTYRFLTQADKALLDAFQDSVMVAASTFTWTSPHQGDGAAYTVRFEGPIKYKGMLQSTLEYEAKITLIED